MESLVQELAVVATNVNTSKTKILTTENFKAPMFRDVGGDMIDVLHGSHKYLGKKILVIFGKSHGGFTTSESERLDEI